VGPKEKDTEKKGQTKRKDKRREEGRDATWAMRHIRTLAA
jgi:hypothetical protein